MHTTKKIRYVFNSGPHSTLNSDTWGKRKQTTATDLNAILTLSTRNVTYMNSPVTYFTPFNCVQRNLHGILKQKQFQHPKISTHLRSSPVTQLSFSYFWWTRHVKQQFTPNHVHPTLWLNTVYAKIPTPATISNQEWETNQSQEPIGQENLVVSAHKYVRKRSQCSR